MSSAEETRRRGVSKDQEAEKRRERIALRFATQDTKRRGSAREPRTGAAEQLRQHGGDIPRSIERLAQLTRDRGVERVVSHARIFPSPSGRAKLRGAAGAGTLGCDRGGGPAATSADQILQAQASLDQLVERHRLDHSSHDRHEKPRNVAATVGLVHGTQQAGPERRVDRVLVPTP